MATPPTSLSRALVDLAKIRLTHDHLLQATDARIKEVEDRAADVVARLTEDSAVEDPDDIEDAAKAFVLGHDLREPLASDLAANERGELDDLRSRVLELLGAARTSMATGQAPQRAVASEMRRWLAAVQDPEDQAEVGQWAEILQQWRQALDDTVREAAAKLGVSPSAVVRYEAGGRLPSIAVLAQMVGAMSNSAALADPDEEFRKARRGIERSFGQSAIDTLDRLDLDRASQIDEVAGQLEEMKPEQLRVVATLVSTPHLLDDLIRWADHYKSDPLRDLFTALTKTGLRVGAVQ